MRYKPIIYTRDHKYVGPAYCRTEMYAGRVACCPLVSHGEYADRTDRQTNGRTDARPLHYAFRYSGQRINTRIRVLVDTATNSNINSDTCHVN